MHQSPGFRFVPSAFGVPYGPSLMNLGTALRCHIVRRVGRLTGANRRRAIYGTRDPPLLARQAVAVHGDSSCARLIQSDYGVEATAPLRSQTLYVAFPPEMPITPSTGQARPQLGKHVFDGDDSPGLVAVG